MAQARRKSTRRKGMQLKRGWVLLALGLGIGVAAVFLGQLVMEHNLAHTVTGWFQTNKPGPAQQLLKKDTDKTKTRFDFYTILPETETVLPDRPRKEPKAAKVEKPEENVSYVLQVAAFNNFEDADNLKAKLALQGLTAQIQKVVIEGKGEYHRVRLGPYDKLQDLDSVNQQLGKMGIKAIRLKVTKKGN